MHSAARGGRTFGSCTKRKEFPQRSLRNLRRQAELSVKRKHVVSNSMAPNQANQQNYFKGAWLFRPSSHAILEAWVFTGRVADYLSNLWLGGLLRG